MEAEMMAAAPSMTLSVTREDAQRMVKASQVLRKQLRQFAKEPAAATLEEDVDEEALKVPKRVVSTSDQDSSSEDEGTTANDATDQDYDRLVDAAEECEDKLIQSFCSVLKTEGFTKAEIQTCLLLFMDSDRNAKIKSSFQYLMKMDTSKKESAAPSIDKSQAMPLFRCLLASICLCIEDKARPPQVKEEPDSEEKPAKARKGSQQSSPSSAAAKQSEESGNLSCKSPSFDDAMVMKGTTERCLSATTMSEINEIATFASDNLYEHAKDGVIDVETFCDWYKQGGFSIVPWLELLDLGKWIHLGGHAGTVSAENSPSKKLKPPAAAAVKNESLALNFFMAEDEEAKEAKTASPPSRTLVTFDFTGASSQKDGKMKTGHSPFCINITEDNLVTIKMLVYRTGLAQKVPADLSKILLRHSQRRTIDGRTVDVLHKDQFGSCIRDLVPTETARSFSRSEMENFSIHFNNFFACYENDQDSLGQDMIDAKELSVGFSLLCAGNKSSKLVNGFELLDEKRQGYLTETQLGRYIRSYLTMLVGISLLSKQPEMHNSLSEARKKDLTAAVDNGAKWTLGHFLKDQADTIKSSKLPEKFSFETFARWYTNGGFNIAPWLELLDLRKLLSLLPETTSSSTGQFSSRSGPMSSSRYLDRSGLTSPRRRRTPGGYSSVPPQEILFTFPLAKDRSLVVLRDDATYVKSVVEKLGLLTKSPDDLWSDLYDHATGQPAPSPLPWNAHRKPGKGKSMDVDQKTFVRSMESILFGKTRTPSKNSPTPTETLENFFQSFDLQQIDRVALNQLMGGLSLLCGGKKSQKLAFSFGLFDSRKDSKGNSSKNPSLNVEDMFVFLRSFLIVMFSCCHQSLDLTADAVSRYISDTANMLADDVMRYQWHTRKKDRVDFDEFGEWYNEGGFETAPWLELLDLNKWVLVDNFDAVEAHRQPLPPTATLPIPTLKSSSSDPHYCPPPPPEDAVDPSFFGDDEHAIMPIDSMDDMDLMLMQQPSQDKENDIMIKPQGPVILSMTPSPRDGSTSSNALKFHLVSHEQHGGYMLSVSQKRVRHLRHVLVESGLYKIDGEAACQKILSKGIKSKGRLILEKDDYDSAMRSIIANGRGKGEMSVDTQRALSDLLAFIFSAFDRDKTGRPDATEIACGFTVLCNGKKSDKLEYAFEVMDSSNRGNLVRSDISNYLRAFLTVLLCVSTSSNLQCNPREDTMQYMNGKSCLNDPPTLSRAAEAGSVWASAQAFKGCYAGRTEQNSLNFDDFADWYTKKGYSCIPWLELLDLRKWVLAAEA